MPETQAGISKMERHCAEDAMINLAVKIRRKLADRPDKKSFRLNRSTLIEIMKVLEVSSAMINEHERLLKKIEEIDGEQPVNQFETASELAHKHSRIMKLINDSLRR